MANSYGYTRIRQLPEATQLQPTDMLVFENDLDTWHIQAQVFYDYVDEHIHSFEDEIKVIIDEKFNDIELLIKRVENLIIEADAKVDEWQKNEEQRQQNEKDREDAETVRDKIFSDMVGDFNGWTDEWEEWVKAEEQRKKNEIARQEAESSREDAENQREQNEQERQTAETNRGVEESKRQKNETARQNAENQRQQNENERIENFNSMTNCFNALEESIENFGKSGISQAVTLNTKPVVSVLELSLPSDVTDDYEALLYIRECNTDKEAFFGLTTHMTISNGSPTAGTVYFNIPNRFKSYISTNNLSCSYRSEEGRIIITLEYKATTDKVKIKTGIIWDNISMYRSKIKPIYSLCLRNEAPKASFTTSYTMTKSTNKTYGSPQGFVTILDKIKEEMEDIVEDIKPFKMHPVGTVYKTTSTKNPAELLGGGTWELLYGDAISENVYIDGVLQYSPPIYYWERTA